MQDACTGVNALSPLAYSLSGWAINTADKYTSSSSRVVRCLAPRIAAIALLIFTPLDTAYKLGIAVLYLPFAAFYLLDNNFNKGNFGPIMDAASHIGRLVASPFLAIAMLFGGAKYMPVVMEGDSVNSRELHIKNIKRMVNRYQAELRDGGKPDFNMLMQFNGKPKIAEHEKTTDFLYYAVITLAKEPQHQVLIDKLLRNDPDTLTFALSLDAPNIDKKNIMLLLDSIVHGNPFKLDINRPDDNGLLPLEKLLGDFVATTGSIPSEETQKIAERLLDLKAGTGNFKFDQFLWLNDDQEKRWGLTQTELERLHRFVNCLLKNNLKINIDPDFLKRVLLQSPYAAGLHEQRIEDKYPLLASYSHIFKLALGQSPKIKPFLEDCLHILYNPVVYMADRPVPVNVSELEIVVKNLPTFIEFLSLADVEILKNKIAGQLQALIPSTEMRKHASSGSILFAQECEEYSKKFNAYYLLIETIIERTLDFSFAEKILEIAKAEKNQSPSGVDSVLHDRLNTLIQSHQRLIGLGMAENTRTVLGPSTSTPSELLSIMESFISIETPKGDKSE